MINFRYISIIDSENGSVPDAIESVEIKNMRIDYKNLILKYRELDIKPEEFLDDEEVYKATRDDIEEIALNWISSFNQKEEHYCYMWLDEICSVYIDGLKASPLEDAKEYVNFNDLKHTVQRAVYELSEHNKSINPGNFTEIFFVIYLDVIEKDMPSFYYNSAWAK